MRSDDVRRRLRELRGSLSQTTLGERLAEIDPSIGPTPEARQNWVSRVERGGVELQVDHVDLWARTLDCEAVIWIGPPGAADLPGRVAALSTDDQRDLVRLVEALAAGRLEPQARRLLTMLLDAAADRPAAPLGST